MGISTRRSLRLSHRLMCERDLLPVVAIEREAFGPLAWEPEEFRECLLGESAPSIGSVCLYDGKIPVGYVVYTMRKRSLLVRSIAVAASMRRLGIGRSIMDDLYAKLYDSHRSRVRLAANVREGNLEAQLFFRSVGFEAVNVLPGYYGEIGEDAYRMVKTKRRCDG